MHSTLLAVHVTLALALTVLLGVQCVELGRLRRLGSDRDDAGTTGAATAGVRAALTAVAPLTVAVVITGGVLLSRHGVRGGPWVGAGVASSVVILVSSLWVRRRAGSAVAPDPRRSTAVLIGAPAFVLAAAFLMAARPQHVAAALVPVVVALAATVVAYLNAAGGLQAVPAGGRGGRR